MYKGQVVRLVRNISNEPIDRDIFEKYYNKDAEVVEDLNDSHGYSELTATVRFLEDGYEMQLMVCEVDYELGRKEHIWEV